MAGYRDIIFKWGGREIVLTVEDDERVQSLKRKLEETTQVLVKRQKLLLKCRNGALAVDDTCVSELALKPSQKVIMMGKAEEDIAATDRQAEVSPHVQENTVPMEDGELQEVALKDREENQEKLRRRIASVNVTVLNPPRPGKKCLVLDIDYTLYDLSSNAERPDELARPYLHEFLAAVYESYDLVIWSATGMRTIVAKMGELGVSGNQGYRLTCFLDHRAMVTVHTDKRGVFDCKPLPFLWAKFPEHYNEANTIMIDDLRRNYVFNPQNGLVIKPYRRAHINRGTDRELLKLKVYLLKIASLPTLTGLRHSRWEKYVDEELRELQD